MTRVSHWTVIRYCLDIKGEIVELFDICCCFLDSSVVFLSKHSFVIVPCGVADST